MGDNLVKTLELLPEKSGGSIYHRKSDALVDLQAIPRLDHVGTDLSVPLWDLIRRESGDHLLIPEKKVRSTGIKIRVATVAETSPPMTVIANG